MRIGHGFDVHQLAAGEELVIGGLTIPHYKGTVGHSDADVLLHAICDALLGALALGDIGQHFPNNDEQYKGIDSKILLQKVNLLIKEKGYTVNNVDSTVALQKPKLMPYIAQMRQTIAQILNIATDCVSVKATTTEKLGFEGQEQGVSAHAVVLLVAR
ncbi:MAG: 2-C-methyl-D-erythritol 2,4-cyclodiphosphate synthase [Bacteroidales bacterium]|nr:2-C-methyl-D-erythritol 2,4-cyclodiphosphate synthase [Bacteroidales bacterium]